MSFQRRWTRRIVAAGAASLIILSTATVVAAHETRTLGEYRVTVGFIGEPVFVDQKSGLEIRVTTENEDPELREPIEGLNETLTATMTKDGQTRDMPLSARFGAPGWYQSVFYPTVEGTGYEIKVTGTIDGMAIDETFVSGEDTFGVIESVQAAQFPVTYPETAELVADVETGAEAASMMPIAIGLGVGALVLSLIALGLVLAGRRPSPTA